MKPFQLNFQPRACQKEAHDNLKRFNVLVWHRRAGKTTFCLVELLRAALKCKHSDGFFAYVAPQRNQAKSVAWDRLKSLLAPLGGDVKFNETELLARLPNGCVIRLYGADNPEPLRGIHLDGAILDEVADMKPKTWSEILRPALSDAGREGWVIFIGTPKGHDFFYQVFSNARTQPDVWFSDLRRASETGILNPAELAQAKADMPPSKYAQEFECDFGASADDTILTFDEVREATERVIEDDSYVDTGARILGVDVARYGSDSSVIIGRQGIWSGKPKMFHSLSTMQLADQIARSIHLWQPDAVFIDIGGIGAGVYDRLEQLRFQVTGVEFGSKASDSGTFRNKRVEMWSRMATWIREGGCLDEAFPVDQILTPKLDFGDAGGRMNLESKQSIRDRGLSSPDVADALALTFACPVFPRSMYAGSAGRADTSYDVFRRT